MKYLVIYKIYVFNTTDVSNIRLVQRLEYIKAILLSNKRYVCDALVYKLRVLM